MLFPVSQDQDPVIWREVWRTPSLSVCLCLRSPECSPPPLPPVVWTVQFCTVLYSSRYTSGLVPVQIRKASSGQSRAMSLYLAYSGIWLYDYWRLIGGIIAISSSQNIWFLCEKTVQCTTVLKICTFWLWAKTPLKIMHCTIIIQIICNQQSKIHLYLDCSCDVPRMSSNPVNCIFSCIKQTTHIGHLLKVIKPRHTLHFVIQWACKIDYT